MERKEFLRHWWARGEGEGEAARPKRAAVGFNLVGARSPGAGFSPVERKHRYFTLAPRISVSLHQVLSDSLSIRLYGN